MWSGSLKLRDGPVKSVARDPPSQLTQAGIVGGGLDLVSQFIPVKNGVSALVEGNNDESSADHEEDIHLDDEDAAATEDLEADRQAGLG
jgi:hypothetical protein